MAREWQCKPLPIRRYQYNRFRLFLHMGLRKWRIGVMIRCALTLLQECLLEPSCRPPSLDSALRTLHNPL